MVRLLGPRAVILSRTRQNCGEESFLIGLRNEDPSSVFRERLPRGQQSRSEFELQLNVLFWVRSSAEGQRKINTMQLHSLPSV